MQRGRKIGLIYRVILAVMGGLALAAKTLVATKTTELPNWIQLGTGGGAAAMLLADNVRSAIMKYREPRWHATRDRVRNALYGGIKSVSDITGGQISVEQLGMSVWRPNAPRLPFCRVKLFRVERYRLSASPQPTHIKWVTPKGVIGQAWKDQKKCHRDLRPINSRFLDGEVSEAAFSRLTEDDTHGFNLGEFRRFVGKYSEVVAVPVKTPYGKIVGVLSVDLRSPSPSLLLYLDSAQVEEILDGVAALIHDDVGKLS